MVILVDHTIAVCTRNRSHLVWDMAKALVDLQYVPRTFILVDSSNSIEERQANEKAVNYIATVIPNCLYYADKPSLAHQRNTAIELAISFQTKFLTFFDDDIRPDSKYFWRLKRLTEDFPEIVVWGGYDLNLPKVRPHLLLSYIGLLPRKPGFVSPSGLALTPSPSERREIVEFVPGGMQTINLWMLGDTRLNEELVFYGEDIEFHLRLGLNSAIASSVELGLFHLGSNVGKEDLQERAYKEFLVPARLHMVRPDRVKKVFVLCGQLMSGLNRSVSTLFQGQVLLAGSILWAAARATVDSISMWSRKASKTEE
jgi:hypothetical protein